MVRCIVSILWNSRLVRIFPWPEIKHSHRPKKCPDISVKYRNSRMKNLEDWARRYDFKKHSGDLIQPNISLTKSKRTFNNAASLTSYNDTSNGAALNNHDLLSRIGSLNYASLINIWSKINFLLFLFFFFLLFFFSSILLFLNFLHIIWYYGITCCIFIRRTAARPSIKENFV